MCAVTKVAYAFMNLKILHSTDADSSHINCTIQSLQQKTVVIILFLKKICFATHSEGDLSDKFELESECLQETVTDCSSGPGCSKAD